MSLRGARLLASAVCHVCSCGGVVASLKFDVRVEYDGSVEYGGSEEYDASLKLDVAWSMVLLSFAPKEQKIKKNTT